VEDDAITVCYKWTADEYVASYEMHHRVSAQPPGGSPDRGMSGSLLLAVLLIPLWIVLGILAVREPGFGVNDLLLLLLVAVSAAFLVLRPRLSRANPRAEFARRNDRDQRVCYTFTTEGLAISTDTSSASVTWENLSIVARSPQGFLFYRDERTFHWAPLHAFGLGDPEALESIVQTRVARYLQM
jgi:hypothetical protein